MKPFKPVFNVACVALVVCCDAVKVLTDWLNAFIEAVKGPYEDVRTYLVSPMLFTEAENEAVKEFKFVFSVACVALVAS